jgi:alkylated DNA repair dioxygenase AlkB
MEKIDLGDGGSILIEKQFIFSDYLLMDLLRMKLPLKVESIQIWGKEVLMPRMTSWHGDVGYRYSGKMFEPSKWTPELEAVRDNLNDVLGTNFNSVLVNYYRHGGDSISWHSDDEPEIDDSAIASISLGGHRRFLIKNNQNKKMEFLLGAGTLLVMKNMQQNWQHSIPKTKKETEPRMNLTFRKVKS